MSYSLKQIFTKVPLPVDKVLYLFSKPKGEFSTPTKFK